LGRASTPQRAIGLGSGASYTRTIDYDPVLREEFTRRQGNFPPQGGGGTPLQGEPRTIQLLSGTFAWNLDAQGMAMPQARPYLDGTPVNELRQLEIMLTPHGFLKAAMGAAPRLLTTAIVGSASDGLTGGPRGRLYRSPRSASAGEQDDNGQNMVELVTTWIEPINGNCRSALHRLQGFRRRQVSNPSPRPSG
jgi:hypothetical protein